MKPYRDPGWYKVVVHFPNQQTREITVYGDSVYDACSQAWICLEIEMPWLLDDWPANKTYYRKLSERSDGNDGWLAKFWLFLGRFI